MTFRKV